MDICWKRSRDIWVRVLAWDISDCGWDQPENEDKVERLISGLSAQRQKKIRSMRQNKARMQSLGAGLLLDHGLRHYGLRERDVRFAVGENGKPYLVDFPLLQFNLSHSGTMILVVFAEAAGDFRKIAVGCDVERFGEPRYAVAKRFFAPEEQALLASCLSDREKQRMFYRIWTLKESYIKATGDGMRMPLDKFDVRPEIDGMPAAIRQYENKCSCKLKEYKLPGFCASACVLDYNMSEESEDNTRDNTGEIFFSFQKCTNVV
ncbi:MAG: 4'-phosphopantetheinyl transferase superfamily protein [Clostridiales bacterium]|nr:4'-phosphopantetheinyl transferase superfamily protein [Clostridiales bacterium]